MKQDSVALLISDMAKLKRQVKAFRKVLRVVKRETESINFEIFRVHYTAELLRQRIAGELVGKDLRGVLGCKDRTVGAVEIENLFNGPFRRVKDCVPEEFKDHWVPQEEMDRLSDDDLREMARSCYPQPIMRNGVQVGVCSVEDALAAVETYIQVVRGAQRRAQALRERDPSMAR